METILQTVMIASPTEMNQTTREKGVCLPLKCLKLSKGIKSVMELQALAREQKSTMAYKGHAANIKETTQIKKEPHK